MKEVTISFADIRDSSIRFARKIHDAAVFDITPSAADLISASIRHVTLSFKGMRRHDWVHLQDLATLACIIRKLAEAERTVVVELPSTSETSRKFTAFLDAVGFRRLFTDYYDTSSWHRRVSFRGASPSSKRLPAGPSIARYVPLQWLDVESFETSKEVTIWRERPRLSPEVEKEFRSVLLSQGFIDSDAIDVFCRTILLEIGWNTVIHSVEPAGMGWGIFGAQIIRKASQPKSSHSQLTFCIADSGRGIPATLRSHYFKASQNAQLYHTVYGVSENTGIVRYSIDPYTTSRPELPSNLDVEGFRGLAFVATSLHGRGEMRIRSAGGAVSIQGETTGAESKLDDSFHHVPLPGVQVYGVLEQQNKRLLAAEKAITISRPSIDVIQVADLDGYCRSISSPERTSAWLKNIRSQADVLLFDLGYSDDIHNVEYLCKLGWSEFPGKLLILWNVRSSVSQLAHLHDWLRQRRRLEDLPPLVVRNVRDAALLGWAERVLKNPPAWPSPVAKWLSATVEASASVSLDDKRGPLRLPLAEFRWLTSEANSAFLKNGFARGTPTDGFCSGTIHLLSGRQVSRYFSLTNNVEPAHTPNLLRWSEAFASGIASALNEVARDDRQPVLIGFTGTIRQVFAASYHQLGLTCPAYVLLTYDIPTKEEIASLVPPESVAILVTDVVSTGSLVDSVYGLVRRNRASVGAVVCLVDARRGAETTKNEIYLGGQTVRFFPCCEFPSLPTAPLTVSNNDEIFWIDPVSLSPTRNRSAGWKTEIDPRIETTFHIIERSHSARCGHIVDGARHTSVYVDVLRLIEADDPTLEEQVRNETTRRLNVLGWTNFDPRFVLFPAGISRIESIAHASAVSASDEDVTVYQTAAKAYAAKLRRIWRNMLTAEVPRAFDPGGGSRCAEAIELSEHPMGVNGDFVIADDGMWRGTAASAIARIAIENGAKRILITPLLARLGPNSIENWENIRSLNGTISTDDILVCYVFPLILPIPYYGAQECPYEVTLKRLQDRNLPFAVLSRCAENIRASLLGRRPRLVEKRSSAFVNTWLRLRAYVELASESEAALEKLSTYAASLQSDDELLALLLLFSEEWRLIERARLRQSTLRDFLRSKAADLARSPDTSEPLRTAAFTVLRSLFPDTFVDYLPDVATFALGQQKALERLVLQAATLSTDRQTRPQCLHFFEQCGDQGPSFIARASERGIPVQVQTYTELITACRTISLQLRTLGKQRNGSVSGAAATLSHLLREDPYLKHKTRPFLRTFAKSAHSIGELSTETFRLALNAWNDTHHSVFQEGIFPALETLRPIILRVGTQGKRFVSPQVSYLTTPKADLAHIYQDVSAITASLQFLSEADGAFFRETLVAAAGRLTQYVVAEDSFLLELLGELRTMTVQNLVENFTSEITSRFDLVGNKVAIEPKGLDHVDSRAFVFAPLDVIQTCAGNILANLEQHAFPLTEQRSGGDNRIELYIHEQHTQLGEREILVNVKDNGIGLTGEQSHGSGGQRAATDLEPFHGRLYPPSGIEEIPWTAIQRVSFLIW